MKYYFCGKLPEQPVQAVRCADEEEAKVLHSGHSVWNPTCGAATHNKHLPAGKRIGRGCNLPLRCVTHKHKAGTWSHSRVGVLHTRRHFETGNTDWRAVCIAKAARSASTRTMPFFFFRNLRAGGSTGSLTSRRPRHHQTHSLAQTLGSRRLMGGQVNASLSGDLPWCDCSRLVITMMSGWDAPTPIISTFVAASAGGSGCEIAAAPPQPQSVWRWKRSSSRGGTREDFHFVMSAVITVIWVSLLPAAIDTAEQTASPPSGQLVFMELN